MSAPQRWNGRSYPLAILGVAALVSFSAFAAVPDDGFHPLVAMASLIPLQLAAVLFAWTRLRR